MLRPYHWRGDHQNPVEVVGHDDERIQHDPREMIRDDGPTFGRDAPKFIGPHFALRHRTEDFGAIMRAKRDEIHARTGVIPASQADGPAPLTYRIKIHGVSTTSVCVAVVYVKVTAWPAWATVNSRAGPSCTPPAPYSAGLAPCSEAWAA